MTVAPIHETRYLAGGRIQAERRKDLGNSTEAQIDPTGEGVTVESPPPVGVDSALEGSLVYPPYGQEPLSDWPQSPLNPCQNPLAKGSYTPDLITIHPHGFSVQCAQINDGEQPDHLKDIERGNIGGFSAAASRRLRQFMLTNWGGDHSFPFAVTLTTHNIYTPEQWRSSIKRFRSKLAEDHPQWAACWRVELQKRKTPHLHCVFYLDQCFPDSLVKVTLTRLWLKAFREESSNAAWQYAVSVKDLSGESGWVIYCTLHDSKHKREQLGWVGKQWGIWNRKSWEPRPALTAGTFTHRQRVIFCRRLRNWSKGRFKGKRVKALRFMATRNIAAFCMDSKTTGQLLREIE